MYRELPLLPALAGTVEAAWVRDIPPGPRETSRILPDGCTDLMWVDGELVVAGPDTEAHVLDAPADARFVAVRFVPGAGPTILGIPAHELRDGRIRLDAIWPAGRVRRLADRLADTPDRAGALQAAVLERLRETGPPDRLTVAAARRQLAGESVAATAGALGLSERQLHRRSLDAFGYGPKQLARILRFRRAVALARAGVRFAEVAVRAGYADQAHLAREVRALAGVPLGALLT
jgi:AraC-like DNA-binding protein